jgi:hypothetical protein
LHRGHNLRISNERVTTTISDTEISQNYARVGGGIFIESSKTANPTEVTLAGTDVNRNESDNEGGGIYVSGSTGSGTTLTLLLTNVYFNTSISNNPATSKGGGLYFLRGTLVLGGVDFDDNTAVTGPQAYRNSTGTAVVFLPFTDNDYEEVVGP